MNKLPEDKALVTAMRWTSIAIMVLLPFHALFTTWLGSNFGNLLFWRSWKELLLLLLLAMSTYLVLKDKKLRHILTGRLINRLIIIYISWHMLVSVFISRDLDALAQGLAINLRFLLFFLIMQIVVFYQPIVKRSLYKIILIPGLGAVAFGLMQMFVLPKDFLNWFGYKKDLTIPPFFTIDEQVNQIRIASTLRGPNDFGAYLVFLIATTGAYFLDFAKKHKEKILATSLILAALVALYGSHSRSAWLAAVAAGTSWVLLKASKQQRLQLIIIGTIGCAVLVGGIYQYRDSNFVRDVILHDDPQEGGSVSSNAGHLHALKTGLNDVLERPLFGCGPGCAGPASVRHEGGTNISESYYLQVAQETGVIGSMLFIAIIVVVGTELYKKRRDNLAQALLACLIGLSVANLLLHTWADDIIALLWWGAAAIVLFSRYNNRKPR